MTTPHLQDLSTDVHGPLALIEHAQQDAEQLGIFQVWGHHQTCALHHLKHPMHSASGPGLRVEATPDTSACSTVLISAQAAVASMMGCADISDGMGPGSTWPRVETAVRRLLPPALSCMASMMSGRTSPMWVRSPGPATLASSPVVASTLATTPLSPPPARHMHSFSWEIGLQAG